MKRITKIRIKKSISKRFRVTKTGKLLRGRQYGRHLQLHKRKNRRRRHKEPAVLVGKQARKIKKLLGYG